MNTKTVLDYQWPYLASFISSPESLDETAKEFGALRRRRSVDSAQTLLRLVFAYGFSGLSLRQTTAWADAAGIASLSDVALLKRLRSSANWLGHLLFLKLADRATVPAVYKGRLRLVDATTISRPGSTGTDWRVHMGLDLGTSTIDHIEVTDVKGGETLKRFSLQKDDVVIGDRGYAHRAGLVSVANRGGDYLVRFPWSTIPLQQPDGELFDLFGFLRGLPEAAAGETEVRLKPDRKNNLPALPARLVAVRKSEAATEDARKDIIRLASKKQKVPDPRTLKAAAFIILITSIGAETLLAKQVLDLYRFRWQIEIAFKRLKGLIDLGDLPAKDPALARAFIFSKLLAALLLDDFSQAFLSFSPWGFNLR